MTQPPLLTDIDRLSSTSQGSALGRIWLARKNADGTSSTDNELADSQIQDPNAATSAISMTTLPATSTDPRPSGSNTTVAAMIEVNPAAAAVNPLPPKEPQVSDSAGHLPLSGSATQPNSPLPASVPQVPTASAVATTVRRFRQRRRQLSSESSSVSHAWSAATAPSSIQNNPATTTGSSAAAVPDSEGARAYSDPTEMMEKRKRCCERAERMRKAYRRRLREEFGQCLSGTEATGADSGSPASRSRQGDEELAISAAVEVRQARLRRCRTDWRSTTPGSRVSCESKRRRSSADAPCRYR